MTCFCLPFTVLSNIVFYYWPFAPFLCPVVGYLQICMVIQRTLTLVALTCDCHYVTWRPLKNRITRFQAKIVIVMLWLIAGIISIPTALYSKIQYLKYEPGSKGICMESWGYPIAKYWYSMFIMFIQYFVPLTIMLITYCHIGIIIWIKRVPGEADLIRDRRIAKSKRKSLSQPGYRVLDGYHMFKAIKSLCSSYLVILAHFEHVSQARPGQTTPAVVGRSTIMMNKLKDWRVLRFMFFLDECSCIDFLDALETANLSLIQLGQQPGEHLQAFLDSLTIDANGQCKYKNTDLTHYDANADYKELQAVIEAVTNRINGIFESDTDPVKPFLQAARVFDIKEWPNDRAHLAAYGNAEIQQLSDHFSDVLDNMGCERNQLQQEWTVVKAHFGNQIRNVPLRPNQNVLDINSLFRDRNRFKHIKRLVQIVLTLLVSSAICERGFSCVKRIKSDW
ncbi:hypothetical protein KUTeg_003960 [Tegillarca granosa]|uniref:G-protein coupled receptors family 1 profile domain-containing protein n=1 Tax=Tegillarca granosa TaxID=220873 RepID=A0ABQ9FNK1_TEGGR|nr:hypothetical protein KUTeg_003960 [Tegillarca granosa]